MTSGHEDFAVHQEVDVIAAGTLVRIAAGVLVIGAIGVGVAGLVLRAGRSRDAEVSQTVAPPAPRSISGVAQTPIEQAEDGLRLRARQRAELRAWGWVDRDAGLARIPIDRAKDLVVERAP